MPSFTPFNVLGGFSPPATEESLYFPNLPINGPISDSTIDTANKSYPFFYLLYRLTFNVSWSASGEITASDPPEPFSESGSFFGEFIMEPQTNEPIKRICQRPLIVEYDQFLDDNAAITGLMQPFQCEKLFAYFELEYEDASVGISNMIFFVVITTGDYGASINNHVLIDSGSLTITLPNGQDELDMNYYFFVYWPDGIGTIEGSASITTDVEWYGNT